MTLKVVIDLFFYQIAYTVYKTFKLFSSLLPNIILSANDSMWLVVMAAERLKVKTNLKSVRIGFTASEAMFENVDGRRKIGYTITSPTDKKYKWAKSKFNTSLACKSIYTFFVATKNEKCIKIFYTFFVEAPRDPYEKCKNFIHFSLAVPTRNV